MTWLNLLSAIAFTAGFALRPLGPGFDGDPTVETIILQSFFYLLQGLRILLGAMALAFVVALVAVWRMRDDTKGKAFLRSTEPVA